MADNLGIPNSSNDHSDIAPLARSTTRQRTPTITIDTTNLAQTHLPPQVTQPTSPKTERISHPASMDEESSSSPPRIITNSPGNLLNVPGTAPPTNHQRSPSFGSSATSGTSGWTPSHSPSTALTPSDIGDPRGDLQNLIKLDSTEADIPDNPFAFTPKMLAKLHDPKDLKVLRQMGGLDGLVFGLRSDVKKGLSPTEDKLEGRITLQNVWDELEKRKKQQVKQGIDDKLQQENNAQGDEYSVVPEKSTDDKIKRNESRKSSASRRPTFASVTPAAPVSKGFSDRKRIFSENRIPARKPKNIFQLMWMALHDKILILLSIAAVVSLALGFYQSFRPGAKDKVEWVEGVAILVAITIVTVVQSVNDYQKERQFMKLNSKKEDRNVKAIRGGETSLVNVYDVVVGDILHLEPGDLIPVDGVLPDGHNIKADESAATGESDALKKVPAQYALDHTEPDSKFSNKFDPFILSGSKVLEGVGKYVVTAVGKNSYHGRTMMSLREEPEDTPLQLKLNRVADMIAKVGGAAALLLFIVLLIKFLASLPGSTLDAGEKGQRFMQILIVSVTIVVVAVPEGLPLAVTLALAYATTRMLKDNNLVRVLKACETMGNATTICSDKTGTLTQNKMTVVAGTIGVDKKFGDKRQNTEEPETQKDAQDDGDSETRLQQEVTDDDAVPMEQFFGNANPEIVSLLRTSITLNSTAFEGTDENGNKEFIGSKTETALLGLAKSYLGMNNVAADRDNANIVQPIPFSSERKCMGCVVKMDVNGHTVYRLLVKGASEILLKHSNQVVDPTSEHLSTHMLSEQDRKVIEDTIMDYATKSLRTIGLVYRDYYQWPPKGARVAGDDKTQANFEDIFVDMVYIGVVGIMDPLRPGVAKAVEDCRKAGVFVRMVTGDNVLTAKAIAAECGIFTRGGIVMEGPKFRTLSPAQMDQIIPRLQVLARSSPEDKRILVKRLKELGETVAVTGDGTNDGPALKMADVGFSMGIAGTEVAKEASSIILMDDNFASIVKAIMWGRCVSDAVKKFLQFQLTVNVTAVGLAFVSSIASSTEESALTAVQLLWVNLIMDTFAALALATDPPTLELLNRKPEAKGASIITFDMWKMIFGQAILQLVITFVLNFAGLKIFTGWDAASMRTVVFNAFVWLQIFNEVNCRRLDNKLNVFSGIHRNLFFIFITLIMIGGQILIVFVGGTAFSVTRIGGTQWAASIILGLLSLPFGAIIRLIPNEFIKIFIPHKLLVRKKKTAIIDEERITEGWNPAIDDVRDDLLFIKSLRSKRRLGTIGNPKKAIRRLIPSSSPKDSTKDDSSSHHRRPSTPGISEHGPASPSPSPSDSKRSRSRSNSAFRPATMVPALVATSMMWSPSSPSDNRRTEELFPVTMSREDLEKVEGIEFHKDTDPNDPIVGSEAASYNPLGSARPRSPDHTGDKGESSKGHWRGRLSAHSRGTSKSSVTSTSPGGSHPPMGGLTAPPRRDVSRDSRSSKSSDNGKGLLPEEK